MASMATRMLATEQAIEEMRWGLKRCRQDVDSMAKGLAIRIEGSDGAEAVWTEEILTEGGGGYPAAKMRIGEAMAKDVAKHCGYPWPIPPPGAAPVPATAEFRRHRMIADFVGCMNARHDKWAEAEDQRIPGSFVVKLLSGPRQASSRRP